ncbi:Glutamate synthase [NADPH] small chain [Posidoniimonas polymericola]|uniref:Glutamate synthase [NADPH] small chain n=1 Tax=Posidoniimonas polymericola TaxID=2528002 RepID=A0A5C5YL53_9BACT|nr:NADPH-dependent glutamate synthase [Posidoniimonas polymericola]TWT75663.1 Glutamate synthase [NADPH] small chain [Posidoniimonas polymericola]
MADKLPPKQRTKIPRQAMPEQPALERARNFAEVNLGLDAAVAEKEAQRCLTCADPKCSHGCPVGVQVREVVDLVRDGDYLRAAAKLREDNVLPAVTGRVCPQENQCEGACILGKRFAPLAIGHIERFVADYERATGEIGLPEPASPTGKKVAVVGSGPAGLSCAGDLTLKGHEVTVMEALHELGGVLVYGIPEFRLPKEIVRNEIENMRKMGVNFETNVVVGKSVTIDQLMNDEGYDAVFIATGAGLPKFLNLPGEHLGGVYSANEFLTRVNLMKAYDPEHYDSPVYTCRDADVVVIGGGNTAMDAVRSALRLGAKSASIIYRRGEAEMPARKEEQHHARDEGVTFLTMHNPLQFLGNDQGLLTGVEVQQMELGEPDGSGRARPIPIAGSEKVVPASVAIVAVGTGANPLVQSSTPEINTNKWGYIQADDDNLRTSKRGVFAGGDIVSGAATVILAMGAGRTAAASIHEYLTTGDWPTAE